MSSLRVAFFIMLALLVSALSLPAAAAWETSGQLNHDPLTSANVPELDVDGSGNAIAVWQQFDGADFNIWASRYDVSAGQWSPAAVIDEHGSGDIFSPKIAVSGSGDAIAVWLRSDGVQQNLWFNRYQIATGQWDTIAGMLGLGGMGNAFGPVVAVDAVGNATAAWHQCTEAVCNIWAGHYDTAGSWGLPVMIQTDATIYARDPQVAVDDAGNAVVVWRQWVGARYNLWFNRYDATSGQWGAAAPVQGEIPIDERDHRIAVDGAGNAILVWRQWDGASDSWFDIWASRYDVATDQWDAPVLIEDNDMDHAYIPQVAVAGNGSAVAVWQQTDGENYNVWINHYDPASDAWGMANTVGPWGSGNAYGHKVASDSSGNVVVVWNQCEGEICNIWSSRYDASAGRWGEAGSIQSDSDSYAHQPKVAMYGNGNAFVLWRQWDGGIYGLWYNHYVTVEEPARKKGGGGAFGWWLLMGLLSILGARTFAAHQRGQHQRGQYPTRGPC